MIDYSIFTNEGDRDNNEDAVNVVELNGKHGFILCDGLGGQGMGDSASQTVVKCFEERFATLANEKSDILLSSVFDYAQERLISLKNRLNVKNKMCTTAVALILDGLNACVGYIGDSRLYMFENNAFAYQTLDHSFPQFLAMRGEISEEEISHHPDRNKLLRVLGTEWEKPMYVVEKPIPVSGNQAFLLCTDGFWEWISTQEIRESLLKSNSATEWLSYMIMIVEQNARNHSMDNYSAIAIIDKGS